MNIVIEEQGLRDGLQSLAQIIPTATKLEWIELLCKAGLKRIQVASFVHPDKVPTMADAESLISQLPTNSNVIFSALVLNEKGLQRAIASGIKHIAISISASEMHSIKNTGMSQSESILAFRKMVRDAVAAGIKVRGGIQCAFGCRYEGAIPFSTIRDLIDQHLECGITELALADSTGMGFPSQIEEYCQYALSVSDSIPLSLHLHNTENKGYANLLSAIKSGVRYFDTAFGGLGGCPFIKGATGNIATEDTVHLIHQMGGSTGIDMQRVAEVSLMASKFIHEPLPGLVYKLISHSNLKE